MIGKILGLATVGSAVASASLRYRLLIASGQIMILVVISSFMLCASLVSLFYMFYFCLIQSGVDAQLSGFIVGASVITGTAIMIGITVSQLRQLRSLSNNFLHGQEGRLPDIGNLALAFIDGFINRK